MTTRTSHTSADVRNLETNFDKENIIIQMIRVFIRYVQNVQNTATLEHSFDALNFHEVKVSAMCLQQNSRDEAYAQMQIKLNNRPGIHNLSAKIDTVTLHCTIKAHSSAEDASVTTQTMITSTAAINSVDDLTRMYPQQFYRIGCFPGEVKLVVDHAVPPRVNPPRKTPMALKDAIKTSLDSMVEDDVIRKVHVN